MSSSAPPFCATRGAGFHTACPAEKSGQEEFDFEYGEEFAAHIEAFKPTFCKVLVRYNPEADPALNLRQSARLRRLSDYLQQAQRSLFMFELLVPAEQAQLDKLKGDKQAYDLELRPQLMVQAIHDLQDAGVEPDIWKIEGLDRTKIARKWWPPPRAMGVVKSAASSLVVVKTKESPRVANRSRVPGFIGFAVGRTTFGTRSSTGVGRR